MAAMEEWTELSVARSSRIPLIYMSDASRDQDVLTSYPAAKVEKENE
jgi:hypothetical protein